MISLTKSKLRSERNTPEISDRVSEAFKSSAAGDAHYNALPVFEHDHWWINCGPCGAQWSVVDAEGGDSVDGFDFEEVSHGDGCCDEHSEDEFADAVDSAQARL